MPTCPRCGQRTEEWFIYCKYCGLPLKHELEEPKKPVTIRVEGEEPDKSSLDAGKVKKVKETEKKEAKPRVKEPVEIEKIPEEVKINLVGRGKTYLVETRLRKLNKDYETLKTRQIVGEITEEELEKRTEPLRQEISEIRKTLEDMGATEPLEAEVLLAEKETQNERKKKLEDLLLKGEIREAIYQKLVSEYDTKLEDAENKLTEGVRQMEKWLISLEAEKQDILDQQEMLIAKMKIGDLPVKEFETHKKELETKLNETDLACQFLEGVIERFRATEENT